MYSPLPTSIIQYAHLKIGCNMNHRMYSIQLPNPFVSINQIDDQLWPVFVRRIVEGAYGVALSIATVI